MRRSNIFSFVCLSLLCFSFVLVPTSARADGTEILGPASIPVASGSDFAIGGVGLYEEANGGFVNLDGDISVSVPGDATVTQVLLYWISEHYPQTGPDSTAAVNGIPVTGTSIGGATNFFSVVYYEAFRVDITDLEPGGSRRKYAEHQRARFQLP